jgi:myosin heavy subunit
MKTELGEIQKEFSGLSDTNQAWLNLATVSAGSVVGAFDGINTVVKATSETSAEASKVTIDGVKKTSEAGSTALKVAEGASGILAIISAAVQLTMAIINIVKKNQAEEAAKAIKKSKDRIDELKKSYNELEKQISKAYSSDASQKIEEQNQNLEEQKKKYEELARIEEEKAANSGKKKEQEAASENAKKYREEIDKINDEMEKNSEQVIDVMFGDNLKSAIDRFAQDYVAAFEKGGDAVKKNQEKFVKDMIRNAIIQMVSSNIAEKMTEFRKYMAEAVLGGISTEEQDVIKKHMEDLTNSANQQMAPFADMFAPDENGAASRQAEQEAQGIARASQESVDINNERLTAMLEHTHEVKLLLKEQMMPKINNIGADLSQSLGVLNRIKEDTGEIRKDVAETKKDTKDMKSAIVDIRDRGLTLKK